MEAAQKALHAAKIAHLKHKIRGLKKRYALANRLSALPRITTVSVNANYINPVTLNKIPSGIVVYKVTDPSTKRVDFYTKNEFWKLVHTHMPQLKNNYNMMMTHPRYKLFNNPVTRNPVRPKNVTRVLAKTKAKTPSPNTAARKIQSAVRKHLSKKRAAVSKSKSLKRPSANKNSPKRPSLNKKSKSTSRSRT